MVVNGLSMAPSRARARRCASVSSGVLFSRIGMSTPSTLSLFPCVHSTTITRVAATSTSSYHSALSSRPIRFRSRCDAPTLNSAMMRLTSAKSISAELPR